MLVRLIDPRRPAAGVFVRCDRCVAKHRRGAVANFQAEGAVRRATQWKQAHRNH